MEERGICEKIRGSEGCLRKDYFLSLNEEEILLLDEWIDETYLDIHHKSSIMNEIAKLR